MEENMMSRLPTQKISIPSANLADALEAMSDHNRAGWAFLLIRSAGADPQAVACNLAGVSIMQAWARNEYSDVQVRHMLRNLMILNPNLREKP
jgi:hypothetical protein